VWDGRAQRGDDRRHSFRAARSSPAMNTFVLYRSPSLSGAGAGLVLGGQLGVARRLGEHVVDLGHGTCLVQLLDGGNLAGHTVERRLVELALRVGLLRLRL